MYIEIILNNTKIKYCGKNAEEIYELYHLFSKIKKEEKEEKINRSIHSVF